MENWLCTKGHCTLLRVVETLAIRNKRLLLRLEWSKNHKIVLYTIISIYKTKKLHWSLLVRFDDVIRSYSVDNFALAMVVLIAYSIFIEYRCCYAISTSCCSPNSSWLDKFAVIKYVHLFGIWLLVLWFYLVAVSSSPLLWLLCAQRCVRYISPITHNFIAITLVFQPFLSTLENLITMWLIQLYAFGRIKPFNQMLLLLNGFN